MATELRGDGIHFGGPVYNQNGNETNDNTYQGRAAAVVKVWRRGENGDSVFGVFRKAVRK